MKFKFYLCVLYIYVFANAQAQYLESQKIPVRSRVSFFDILIEDLKNAGWSDGEHRCYEQTLAVLGGAKNSTLWATWVWDSNQLPTGVLYGSKYQLGNYDECIKAPWSYSHPELRTQYCLVDIKLTTAVPKRSKHPADPYGPAVKYINTMTRYRRELNVLTWGVCIPESCSTPQSVSRIAKILLQNSHMDLVSASPSVINVDSCQPSRGATVERAAAGYSAFKYFIMFLLLTTICSTIYTSCSEKADTESILTKIASSFCFRRNGYDIVKEVKDDKPYLHGIRAMTTILIITLHLYTLCYAFAIANGSDCEEHIENGLWTVSQADLTNESYFVISGMLSIISLMAKKTLENPFKFLLKQYIRLNGVVAVVMWYIISVAVHMGDGPLWKRFTGQEQAYCEQNWWLNMLLLNNYININGICYIVTWFSTCNYHFTILGVALFYLCRSYRRAGMVTIATLSVLAIILPGFTTYYKGQPPISVRDIKFFIDPRKDPVMTDGFCQSHIRVGSYLVGLGCGYFLSVYKQSQYRNKIGKNCSLIVILSCFAMGVFILVLGATYGFKEYSVLEGVLYATTHRIIWSLLIVALVFMLEYGSENIVTRLLSWRGWVPLSRLALGASMTNQLVIQHGLYSSRTPITMHFVLFYETVSNVVVTYIVSMLLWFLFQAPLYNLTNEILSSRKNTKNQADKMQSKQMETKQKQHKS